MIFPHRKSKSENLKWLFAIVTGLIKWWKYFIQKTERMSHISNKNSNANHIPIKFCRIDKGNRNRYIAIHVIDFLHEILGYSVLNNDVEQTGICHRIRDESIINESPSYTHRIEINATRTSISSIRVVDLISEMKSGLRFSYIRQKSKIFAEISETLWFNGMEKGIR